MRESARICQTHRVLIGLFPELDGPGGIQRASRHLALVLSDFASTRKMDYRLLSLNDSEELHRSRIADREFVFTGAARGKGRFTATALKAARRHPLLVLAAHPNLAPILRGMNVFAPRMKSIICTHGVEVGEALGTMRRRALERATLVLAPSHATAELVVSMQGVAPERVRVLPWGLDPDFEALHENYPRAGLPAEFPPGRAILSVGRWVATERYKGMDTLIRALPRLLLRWPDAHLVLVGSGDDQGWLKNIARDSGVERHVHFLSGLSDAGVAACYRASELFALPSRGEGFGFVYLEAMASGLPVVAGAHGSGPELVEDGVTGYLVPHGDAVQLATSIDLLLSDPELARRMGARGRERVHQQFRFVHFAEAFEKILSELCEF